MIPLTTTTMTSLFSTPTLAHGIAVDVIVTESVESNLLFSTEFLVRFQFGMGKSLLCSSLGLNRACDWRNTSLSYSCVPPKVYSTDADLDHAFNRIGEIGSTFRVYFFRGVCCYCYCCYCCCYCCCCCCCGDGNGVIILSSFLLLLLLLLLPSILSLSLSLRVCVCLCV